MHVCNLFGHFKNERPEPLWPLQAECSPLKSRALTVTPSGNRCPMLRARANIQWRPGWSAPSSVYGATPARGPAQVWPLIWRSLCVGSPVRVPLKVLAQELQTAASAPSQDRLHRLGISIHLLGAQEADIQRQRKVTYNLEGFIS